jgi:hypothetical protein
MTFSIVWEFNRFRLRKPTKQSGDTPEPHGKHGTGLLGVRTTKVVVLPHLTSQVWYA